MLYRKLFPHLLGFFLILTIFFYVFTPFQSELDKNWQQTFYYLAPVLAVVCGVLLCNKLGWKSSKGRVFMLLTAGITCWLIGEYIFLYYDKMTLESPYPSIADFFFLVGYPLLFFAFLKELKDLNINFSKQKIPYGIVIYSLAILLTVLVVYFGFYKAIDPEAGALDNTIDILYGLADLLLVFLAIVIFSFVYEYKKGKYFVLWFFVLLFLLGSLIADILFASYNDQYIEWIRPYYCIDLAWIGSYWFFAYGCLYYYFFLKEKESQLKIIPKK